MIQAIDPAVADLLKGLPRELDNESDRARLVPALQFALTTYGDERRPSGETYVEHGRNVVGALSELGIMDTDTVIATLLHDTLLPQFKVTDGALVKHFGREVAALIRGVKTLDDYSKQAGRNRQPAADNADERQDRDTLEAIRRALLSNIEGDIRVILIRMVDSLQDLRRAANMPLDLQRQEMCIRDRRKGLGLAAPEPLFVLSKDAAHNALILSLIHIYCKQAEKL